MLAGYERTFNQADFERRLRHYFSDSAPCVIRYRLGLDTIEVENTERENACVRIKLDAAASEEENVRIVIHEVESALYPVLIEVTEEPEPVDPEEVVKRVAKGVSLVNAMDSVKKRIVKKEFRVIRIGINNNTLVLRGNGARTVYHLLYMPILKFLEYLSAGKYTAESGYDYLIRNSQVKENGDFNG